MLWALGVDDIVLAELIARSLPVYSGHTWARQTAQVQL